MTNKFTFEDAQKGIEGTPVPVDLGDHGTQFWLKELGFRDSSTGQTDPASPADARSPVLPRVPGASPGRP